MTCSTQKPKRNGSSSMMRFKSVTYGSQTSDCDDLGIGKWIWAPSGAQHPDGCPRWRGYLSGVQQGDRHGANQPLRFQIVQSCFVTVFKKAYLDLKSDIKSGALSLSDSRFFSRNSILHIQTTLSLPQATTQIQRSERATDIFSRSLIVQLNRTSSLEW